MYLHNTIKEKFINEAANLILSSSEDYSDYINENKNFQYYTELIPYHLIGYYKTEMFLTENGSFSGFNIVEDYVNDFRDLFGDSPKNINSESVFQFYLDNYVSELVFILEDNQFLFTDEGLKAKTLSEAVEKWRTEAVNELYKF